MTMRHKADVSFAWMDFKLDKCVWEKAKANPYHYLTKMLIATNCDSS